LKYGDYQFVLSYNTDVSALAEFSPRPGSGIEVSLVYEAFRGGLSSKEQANVHTPRF